jgi:hypothetical protein
MLGKTALREVLMGTTGLCECGCLWNPLSHKLTITILKIKNLNSARVADAASFHSL